MKTKRTNASEQPEPLSTEAEFRAHFASLPSTLQERLRETALQRARDELTLEAAGEAGFDALLESHAQAAYAGRGLAGALDEFGELDEAVGRLIAEEQAQYFEKFLSDIGDGKYTLEDGLINEEAIETRAGQYNERLRGTANESWATALPLDELLDWVLGATEDSCSVCPDLAEQGPYKPTELPTYPGANETPCLFNCGCSLRTQSGAQGF
jgi:hypothetical protein